MNKTYRELIAWQKSMILAGDVYRAIRSLPPDERDCLSLQMRKAAVSVPSNIAEGQGRGSIKDFLHFLSFANGSLRELQTQTILSGRLGYLKPTCVEHLIELSDETGRLIKGLSRSLQART